MNALSMSLAACAWTTAGGLLAFAWRDRLRSVLAFRVGTLLGIAAVHLLPESVELARHIGCGLPLTGLAALVGLGSLHAVGRWTHRHGAHAAGSGRCRTAAGVAPTAALVGHSFMDGAGIGLAFQASPSLGVSMALAVAAHGFCDGLNTVGLMLSLRHRPGPAIGMLALDALAPIAGATVATAIPAPPVALAVALGYLGGCLLHITAADLLPRVFDGGLAMFRWRLPLLIGCGLAFAVLVPHGMA